MQPALDQKLVRNDAAAWLRSNILLIIAVIVSALIGTAISQRLDTRIGDLFLTQLGEWQLSSKDIVIVTITEDTLANLPYRSPLDRRFLANLIKQIDSADPKVIGVDILVDQPTEPAKDQLLSNTLRQLNAPVVMAFADGSDGLTDKQADHIKKVLNDVNQGRVTLIRDGADGTVRHWGNGHLATSSLPDGFALAIAKAAGASAALPNNRITYYTGADSPGTPFAMPMYPAHTVHLLPKQWFHNKIVLIGATIPNIDQHRTPFVTAIGIEQGTMYGITIHAHMVAQLLRGDRVWPVGLLATLFYCLFLAAAAAGIMTTAMSLTLRLAAIAGLFGCIALAAVAAYTRWHTELPLAAPLMTVLLAASALALQSWYRDRAQRLFIQRAFSQYVSPAVVERIAADHSSLRLGGEVRTVTYLFTDLQGFTSLSENLEPDKVASLLNAYLNEVCALFIDHGATIDKIIGDAVAGFFGAPSTQADQAERAVALALAIDEFSETFRKRHSADGIALGITRIGVHKGRAIIGNFGGSRFFDYTGIGDTVNTAARMEGANKYFGTRVCVSDAVASDAPSFSYRPIGDIIFKGKSDPIRCLEPVSPEHLATLDVPGYARAFNCLSNHDNPEAAFADLHDKAPQDPLIGFHLQRLRDGEQGTRIVLTDK